MTKRLDLLDRLCPGEAHLPPGARTWARIIRLPGVAEDVLELRDPNSGLDQDPASKPRHQYLVARERLWRRSLPPAPLDQPGDEARWADEPAEPAPRTASAWRLVEPGTGVPWEWAGLPPYPTRPRRVEGEWALSGDRRQVSTVGYEMPARDPWDPWADVTGAPCPSCDQTLVWWEAGYVPGYRVCLAEVGPGQYDVGTLRHRWLWWHGILVLV